MTETILLAEDDRDIAEILQLYLESSGYQVLTAEDGQAAYQIFQAEAADLAILDIMMPGLNGYELTKAIRRISNIPIIILSAKSEHRDKILGLDIGADDYLTKPFEPLEVLARVKSNLRRYKELGGTAQPALLKVQDLTLDPARMMLDKAGQPIHLTATEFRVLQTLMAAPGQIFSRQQLYQQVSGDYLLSDEQTMMVHISNLREKIETDPKRPAYIKTVRGVGYKIDKKA